MDDSLVAAAADLERETTSSRRRSTASTRSPAECPGARAGGSARAVPGRRSGGARCSQPRKRRRSNGEPRPNGSSPRLRGSTTSRSPARSEEARAHAERALAHAREAAADAAGGSNESQGRGAGCSTRRPPRGRRRCPRRGGRRHGRRVARAAAGVGIRSDRAGWDAARPRRLGRPCAVRRSSSFVAGSWPSASGCCERPESSPRPRSGEPLYGVSVAAGAPAPRGGLRRPRRASTAAARGSATVPVRSGDPSGRSRPCAGRGSP